MDKKNILKINHLKKYFPVRKGILLKKTREIKAVDDVSFKIKKGTTYGLVGESGSGKSTLARTILKLIPLNDGKIIFDNQDITDLKEKEFRLFRKKIQVVFQDPLNSLDPRCKVDNILKEAIILLNGKLSRIKLNKKIEQLLEMVNISTSLKYNYPHQISGGQAQRVCIARTICGNPELIILDEPTSGLDITTATKLLKLLLDLQKTLNISYLFISHDLKLVKKMSNRIGVMLNGKIIEEKSSDKLFLNPTCKYTKNLLKASLFK